MSVDAGKLGALLSVLWAAHDVADHVVQTDHQAVNKADSWSAMAGHVGAYTALQLLALQLLRAAGVRPSWRRLLVGVAFSAGTHALLDRRWPVRWVLEHTGSANFAEPEVEIGAVLVDAVDWRYRLDQEILHGPGAGGGVIGVTRSPRIRTPLHGRYLADQALHHGVLAACAAILAGGAR